MRTWCAFFLCLATLSACAFEPRSARRADPTGSGGVLKPCKVRVVDRENGWPVPLVFLTTTHDLQFVTDNAGVVAIDSPELMGRECWFSVKSHGYGRKKDGFGNAGVRLVPEPGKTLTVQINRQQIAKRLGRIGGGGLFAESQKCGDWLAARESGEFGRDSVQTALYHGRIFWLWGDTNLPHYPLGIFNVSAATSPALAFVHPIPPIDPPYTQIVNEKGKPRGVIKRQGGGPIWIFGLVTLKDVHGREHLCGAWSQIKEFCTPEKTGLCEWDDAAQEFKILKTIWTRSKDAPKSPRIPDCTVCRAQGALYFGNPFPFLRIPDSYEAYCNPATWQQVQRVNFCTARDGTKITTAAGHMVWNAYRKKFVAIVQQKFGKPSAFGEIWYVESDSVKGPWRDAVKVVTHDNYTFYNPVIHTEVTDPKSPVLLFEGTYTSAFADKPKKTPRWNYTQVLYRLDLDDPRLGIGTVAGTRDACPYRMGAPAGRVARPARPRTDGATASMKETK